MDNADFNGCVLLAAPVMIAGVLYGLFLIACSVLGYTDWMQN